LGDTDLEQIGAYILYAADHPKNGQIPEFSPSQQKRFQKSVIDTLKLATDWRSQLECKQFHTVHYIKLHAQGLLQTAFDLPALKALVLPTVLLGKENARVSAIIQTVSARFRDEAKQTSARQFSKLLALLTLAAGQHFEPYRSTLGRIRLKEFAKHVHPALALEQVYPKGKYKNGTHPNDQALWNGLRSVSAHYSTLDTALQRKLGDSIFAYYTAKEMLSNFPTVAAVALIASLKLFRKIHKCDGSVICSRCGSLNYRHDLKGESRSISDAVCDEFGLGPADERRIALGAVLKDIYSTHRSGYVHDAILRHGEFNQQLPDHLPSTNEAISRQLRWRNGLMTMDLVSRRALLHCIHRLAGKEFDPLTYGIDRDKFKSAVGSTSQFVVGSKYRVGIRPMGAFQ
jgi:hypothetical protein